MPVEERRLRWDSPKVNQLCQMLKIARERFDSIESFQRSSCRPGQARIEGELNALEFEVECGSWYPLAATLNIWKEATFYYSMAANNEPPVARFTTFEGTELDTTARLLADQG